MINKVCEKGLDKQRKELYLDTSIASCSHPTERQISPYTLVSQRFGFMGTQVAYGAAFGTIGRNRNAGVKV